MAKHRAISRRRRWLFRLAAVILMPAGLLLVLEFGLRLAGFGYETSFFVPLDGDEYVTNQHFGWRFFPPHLARRPVPRVISRPKSAGTYRIFILGGSAAQGTPDEAYSFGRVLRVMLERAYPDRRFEVINTAMTAINSHVVREIARDCAAFEPDLFVVYMGNNEVVGPYGPGTVFAGFLDNLTMIRLSIAVRKLRIAQGVDRITAALAPKRGWRGLEMFADRRVPANDPRLARTYAHFKSNLRDLCAAGPPAILCTVATNLKDCPPFASVHVRNLTPMQLADWQTAFERAVAKKGAEAIELFEQAVAMDDGYAELTFRLGRAYEAKQNYDRARDWYVAARDADALRFRADSRINDLIRESAGEAALVDVDRAFEQQDGIAGSQWFYEHVHLRFAGQWLIAATVFEQIQPQLGEPAGVVAGVEACADALALTDWQRRRFESDMRQMMKRPPFTLQLDHDKDLAQRDERIETLQQRAAEAAERIVDMMQAAVERRPNDLQLRRQFALMLIEMVRAQQAERQWRQLLNRVPQWGPWLGELGKSLAQQRRAAEAVEPLRRALRWMPDDVALMTNLGVTLMQLNQMDEAEEILQRAIAIEPDHVIARNNLGLLFGGLGRFDEAEAQFAHAIEFDPDNADLHYNLGRVRETRGDKAGAASSYQQALAVNPDYALARQALDALGAAGTPGTPGTPRAPGAPGDTGGTGGTVGH